MKKTTLSQSVLTAIKEQDVHIRPRWHYSVLIAIGTIASLLAGLLLAYITSLSFMAWRIATAATPAYGARQNFAELAAEFPWPALIIAILLVAAGIYIMREHSRLYRKHLGMVIAAFIVTSIFIGLIFSSFGIGTPDMQGNGRHTTPWQGRWNNR